MSHSYHTRISTITAALRALADRLDADGDTTIAVTNLDVSLQVSSADHPLSDADDDYRAATVEELNRRVGATPTYKYSDQYGTEYFVDLVHGVDFAAYGTMTAPPHIIDDAHTTAYAMTCDTDGCTNLPPAGRWFCNTCTDTPSVAPVPTASPVPAGVPGGAG